MTEENDSSVELGEHHPVAGAPLARVADRLTWPIERSTVHDREGDTEVRTPNGPRPVAELLVESDTDYFPTREAFVDALEAVIDSGPIQPTEH